MSGSAFPHQHAALQDKDAPKSHELQSDLAKLKTEADGSFKRQASSFRRWIEPNGEFTPEKDRYHLYVSYSCPWATRTLIVRKLKGLEDFISVSAVSPHVGKDGWSFADVDAYPGADKDPLNGARHLKDIYFKAKAGYDARFTVPVLWDKEKGTIVNNESSEIIRMLNTAFNHLLPKDKAELDFYPEDLRSEIDSVNEWVYDTVNNGVYRSGFASTQQAYEAAVIPLFKSLDRLEQMLDGKEYLIGDRLTEVDIRLFVTIVRFDPVYYSHFKCNLRTIREGYPNLHLWMRKLYWNNAAFKDTCNFDHIKVHYYWSQVNVNPTRIVPIGPEPYILPL